MKKRAPKFTRKGVRAFFERPWGEVEAAKARYWSETHEADETATIRASQSMWSVFRDAGFVTDEAEREKARMRGRRERD